MLNKKIILKYESSTAEYHVKEQLEEFNLDTHDVLIKINSCGLSKIRQKILKQFCDGSLDEYPVGREISGTVETVGLDVTRCKPEDDVTGIIPISSIHSGCSHYCILSEYDIVIKPDKVSHVDAACGIGDSVKAYTALLYQAKITSGETVVIAPATKGFGIIATQLAHYWGAKVIVLGSTDEEMTFLKSMEPPADQVIDLRNKRRDIVSICLEETGGLGVDCFVDDGVRMYSEEFTDNLLISEPHQLLTKHDVISCLSVGGRWVTTQPHLQIDPPDSEMLTLKCASIHYLFEHVWTLSRGALGRYLHILKDIMNKMAAGVLRPTVHHTVLLDDCVESLNKLDYSTIGKKVEVHAHWNINIRPGKKTFIFIMKE